MPTTAKEAEKYLESAYYYLLGSKIPLKETREARIILVNACIDVNTDMKEI
jgi:hypothetical protein